MRQLVDWKIRITIAALIAVIAFGGFHNGRADDNWRSLSGRIVAIDIPGAAAVAPVAAFLPGGPIHDKPEFAAYTQPAQVLYPARILVGSTSHFEKIKRWPLQPLEGGRIPYGRRHNTLVSLAGTLRARNVCDEAIEACLQIVNERQYERPGPRTHIS
jgi:hypothetical protein